MKYIKKYFKYSIIFLIIGLSIGLFYNSIQTNKYVAESAFIIEEKSNNLGGLSLLASNIGIDLNSAGSGTTIYSGDNILEIMRSKIILNRVLLKKRLYNGQETTLADNYFMISKFDKAFQSSNPFKAGFSFANTYQNMQQEYWKDSILNLIIKKIKNKQLTIERVNKKSSILYVKFKCTDQVFAKIFLDDLIFEAKSLYLDIKTQTLKKNIANLEVTKDSIYKTLINKSQQALNTEIYNLNPAIKSNLYNKDNAEREKNIANAVYVELCRNIEAAKISLSQFTPVIQIIETPELPLTNLKKSMIFCIAIGIFVGIAFYFIYVTLIFIKKEKIIQKLLIEDNESV
ncbi:MAG: hypothetical protein QM539_02905 [Alphaproteobacteria bacterium]|nr:hypothetical protein [Alphaproteobacteria bacterium]